MYNASLLLVLKELLFLLNRPVPSGKPKIHTQKRCTGEHNTAVDGATRSGPGSVYHLQLREKHHHAEKPSDSCSPVKTTSFGEQFPKSP